MNEDLKLRIDEAVEPEVPFDLDLDGLVTAERRRHRRRTGYGIGGMAIAVVAVVAVAMGTLGAGPGTVAPPVPAASGDPKTGDLPKLDSDHDYSWVGNTRLGTPSEAYTEAFWSYFDAQWPDAEPDWTVYEYGGAQSEPSQESPGINQFVREVLDNDTNETVYSYESLGLQQELTVDGETRAVPGMQLQFGDGVPNLISVAVHPAGSFTIGDDGFFDLTRCDDEDKLGPVECDAGTAEGPGGEKIYNLESRMRDEGGDTVRSIDYQTVILREDGSAVVVSDYIAGKDPGQNSTDVAGAVPQLDFEELAGIGLSLPVDPIR